MQNSIACTAELAMPLPPRPLATNVIHPPSSGAAAVAFNTAMSPHKASDDVERTDSDPATSSKTSLTRSKSGDVCLNPNFPTNRTSTTNNALGDRFLHSEELLAENHESTDDDTVYSDSSNKNNGNGFNLLVEESDNDSDDNDSDDDDDDNEIPIAPFQGLKGRGDSLSPVPAACRISLLEGESNNTSSSSMTNPNNGKSKRRKRNPRRWAKRQLHRSVSLDDLMEYQREFEASEMGRSNSFSDLTAHHKSSEQIPPEEQIEQPPPPTSSTSCKRSSSSSLLSTAAAAVAGGGGGGGGENNKRPESSSSSSSNNCPRRSMSTPIRPSPLNQKHFRKSIANSDLAEFKRFFSQNNIGLGNDAGSDSDNNDNFEDETDNGIIGGASSRRQGEKSLNPATVNSTVLSNKLSKLQETKEGAHIDYQWGTRSLRRAILGSDLAKFERSVRTALLENSRENSSDNLEEEVGASLSSTVEEGKGFVPHGNSNVKDKCPSTPSRSSSNPTAEANTITSDTIGKVGEIMWGDDWGTRSLRKSLRELDLNDAYHDPPTSAAGSFEETAVSRIMETIHDDKEANHVQPVSPWKDDKKHPASPFGLRMPNRVMSDNPQSKADSCDPLTPPTTPPFVENPTSASQFSSVGDNGTLTPVKQAVVSDAPEFEWQRRSPFRRSISSSDIEKYQRHFDGGVLDESFGALSDSDDEDDVINQEIEAIRNQASQLQSADSNPELTTTTLAATLTVPTPTQARAVHPLQRGSARKADTCASNRNDAMPKQPKRGKKKRRSHQRSISDVPELHLDIEASDRPDLAPKKPTRTSSRPKSPPPVFDAKPSVRFATSQNQMMEIPKVTDDMKPFLFYTKRDVKRFRMNEHRRQEEQIRQYMEYLNEKDNALDASPSIFGK